MPICTVPASSAEAIDCSFGIVLISTCERVTVPPHQLGFALTVNESFGTQLTNWNGPVPTGVFESVPAAIDLVESIARLSEVRPSSTEVSGRDSSSFTA